MWRLSGKSGQRAGEACAARVEHSRGTQRRPCHSGEYGGDNAVVGKWTAGNLCIVPPRGPVAHRDVVSWTYGPLATETLDSPDLKGRLRVISSASEKNNEGAILKISIHAMMNTENGIGLFSSKTLDYMSVQ